VSTGDPTPCARCGTLAMGGMCASCTSREPGPRFALAPHAQRPGDYEQKERAVLEAAVAWLDAYDAVQASTEAFRGRLEIDAHMALEETRRKRVNAIFVAAAAVRDFVSPPERHPVTETALENERLRAKVAMLRHEVNEMRLSAERRNRDLDALHLVWCDGGCTGGVHRYCGKPEDVTEAVVEAAEANTERLRRWWDARQARAAKGGAR